MSQRNSEYERKPYDLYETPEWVTEALYSDATRMPLGTIWEPACGSGKMVRALEKWGHSVIGTDVLGSEPKDFLQFTNLPPRCLSIITNPPYGPRGTLARAFIEKALHLTQQAGGGMVAMLLRVDFDSAKTRACIFGDHPAFARKITLRKRIKWFDNGSKNGASENHAWFIWDWSHEGPPTIGYAP